MKNYPRLLPLLLMLLAVTGCAVPFMQGPPPQGEFASGHYSSDIVQCVPYARRVSGIELRGDAYSWWAHAASHYNRGHRPEPRAVLVLKRTSHMPAGHVAVVKDVLGPRIIDVTHSNWGESRSRRHIIYDSMRVEDISAANNWSQVRFFNEDKGVMGFPYAAYGFIYP